MKIPLLSRKWFHIYTQSAEFNTAEDSGDPQTDLQSRTSSVIDNSLEQRHRHLTERALWSGHGSCNSNNTTLAEYSYMLHSSCCTHLEDNILQTSRFRSGLMDTNQRRANGHTCYIKDEVADLSIKDICRTPIQIGGVVAIAINQTESREARSSFQNREIIWVADELS